MFDVDIVTVGDKGENCAVFPACWWWVLTALPQPCPTDSHGVWLNYIHKGRLLLLLLLRLCVACHNGL